MRNSKVVDSAANVRDADLQRQIRERAYEFWEQAGRSGDALEHWVRAERELTQTVPDSAPPGEPSRQSNLAEPDPLRLHLRMLLDPERKRRGPLTNWAQIA